MKNVKFNDVKINGGIWLHEQKLNEDVTIDAVWNRFYDTGRVEAFACKWKEGDDFKPHVFWDSDVAKWIEGASNILMKEKRPDLEEKIEHVIDMMEANAWEDGYINSHFTVVEPEARFTNRSRHELYCCGHLIEAAIAYRNATGRDRMLKLMCRYADLIDRIFRVEGSAAFSTPGHEEIELALFRLADATGEEKYAKLAEYFLEARGTNEKDAAILDAEVPSIKEFTEDFNPRVYAQDYPIRDQKRAVGHSVRAMYLYTAMADLARKKNDKELLDTCRSLVDDIMTKKMYITGGLGSAASRECFTKAYDLPNAKAYCETCAGIAMMLFCERMLRIEWQAKYADIIERIFYNGFLSGISLDGKAFFYENPLEIDLADIDRPKSKSKGEYHAITERVAVFDCSCCPPNMNRMLSSLGDYIYSVDGKKVAIQQYVPSECNIDGMKIEQITDYPASGNMTVKCSGVDELWLRVPGWCRSFKVDAEYETRNGYLVIKDPANVVFTMDMPIMLNYADPRVRGNGGRCAVSRGPVVYCAEGKDNGNVILDTLSVNRDHNGRPTEDSFNGIPCIEVNGYEYTEMPTLYAFGAPAKKEKTLKLIPYFAFANRGTDNMQVWIREEI